MKNFQSFSSIFRTQTSKAAMWGGKYQFIVSELPLQNSEIEINVSYKRKSHTKIL